MVSSATTTTITTREHLCHPPLFHRPSVALLLPGATGMSPYSTDSVESETQFLVNDSETRTNRHKHNRPPEYQAVGGGEKKKQQWWWWC